MCTCTFLGKVCVLMLPILVQVQRGVWGKLQVLNPELHPRGLEYHSSVSHDSQPGTLKGALWQVLWVPGPWLKGSDCNVVWMPKEASWHGWSKVMCLCHWNGSMLLACPVG